MHEGIG
jgi:hypothetical protein